MERLSYFEAIGEVGRWSKRNFGNQAGLGAIAPFLGAVEEAGEFMEATSDDECVDALIDELVFMADLCYRSNIMINPSWEEDLAFRRTTHRDVARGRVAHALLKRAQGIRGYNNVDKFQREMQSAMEDWFYAVARDYYGIRGLARDFGDGSLDACDLCDAFTKVWDEVSKRDWRANPENAHEVAKE